MIARRYSRPAATVLREQLWAQDAHGIVVAQAAQEGMQHYDLGGYTVGHGPASRSGSSYVDLTIIGRDGQFLR